jgi:hypothetical protein
MVREAKMPRRRSDGPRVRQLLIRITARQLEVLESVAHLSRQTPNAYAHQLLIEHLSALSKDQFVKADLDNRAAFDAVRTIATPLRRASELDAKASPTPAAEATGDAPVHEDEHGIDRRAGSGC